MTDPPTIRSSRMPGQSSRSNNCRATPSSEHADFRLLGLGRIACAARSSELGRKASRLPSPSKPPPLVSRVLKSQIRNAKSAIIRQRVLLKLGFALQADSSSVLDCREQRTQWLLIRKSQEMSQSDDDGTVPPSHAELPPFSVEGVPRRPGAES